MKILSIGNSFSQDSHAYLKKLADASCADAEFLNLIIGGCSLERHATNVKEGLSDYMVQYNGKDYFEEYHCTIEEGLAYREWDYITVQQVSGLSGEPDTYYPHIDLLVKKIREMCPRAKLLVHQTWAYEHGANHAEFYRYGNSPEEMTTRLTEAYDRAAEHIGAAGIIPTGNVIQSLRNTPEFDIRQGGVSLHRDGFHLSHEYGRYAAAAVWYTALGLGDIESNEALPDGEGLDMRLIKQIKKTVKELVKPVV